MVLVDASGNALADPLAALGHLVGLRDPVGVLSVYVDARPELGSGTDSVGAATLRTSLEALEEQVRREGPPARADAVLARLASLEHELAALVEPGASGKGRALFATVAGGEVEQLAMQLPLPNRLVLARTAHVRPLATALAKGHPAGIAVVSTVDVRVLEWHYGTIDDVATFVLEADTEGWRMMKGPAAPVPGLGQQSASQEDRFARRLHRRQEQLVAALGADLADLAHNHGWDRLVVAGDERLVGPLTGGRRRLDHVGVLTVPVIPGHWLPAQDLGVELVPYLEEAREARDLDWVEQARGAALSGGPGALGLADTLAALQEGRVHRLLLDPELDWRGAEAPDGSLYPPGIVPPGLEPAALVPEPLLGDRMIELALRTDAEVSILTGPAADALAGDGGVAAILRW